MNTSLVLGLLLALGEAIPVDLTRLDEYDLRMLAEDAIDRRQNRQCGELFRLAMERDPARAAANGYMSASCMAAVDDGDRHAELARLRRAVELGYPDADQMRADRLLAPLRQLPEWEEILARAEANQAAYLATINRRLRRIFREDQAHRGPAVADWHGDLRRRREVKRILDAGGARVSADYYHAAMVFQHGAKVADYALAHQLARRAVELDPHNDDARWLAAAAKDRELVAQRKAQRYGTQIYTRRDTGELVLFPVDPSVSDAERKQWNVKPLGRMVTFILRSNKDLRSRRSAADQARAAE